MDISDTPQLPCGICAFAVANWVSIPEASAMSSLDDLPLCDQFTCLHFGLQEATPLSITEQKV